MTVQIPSHLVPIARQMLHGLSVHLADTLDRVIPPGTVEGGTRWGSDGPSPTIEYDDAKRRLTVTGTVTIDLDLAAATGQN